MLASSVSTCMREIGIADALVPVLRRRVVIGGGDDRRDAPGLAAREPQALVRLRARHLVHEMAVDVDERRAVRFGADDVAVPQLVVERARCMVIGRDRALRAAIERKRLLHGSIALSGAGRSPSRDRNAATLSARSAPTGRTAVAGVARSQVNWRFASWRVAAIAVARSVARIDAPSRNAHACR